MAYKADVLHAEVAREFSRQVVPFFGTKEQGSEDYPPDCPDHKCPLSGSCEGGDSCLRVDLPHGDLPPQMN